MKRFLFAALAALGILFHQGGCSSEIGIETAGPDGHRDYNTQAFIFHGMSPDTTNLLGNYLLADMLKDAPENFVTTLEDLLNTDNTQKVRIALAETGLILAERFRGNPDLSVRYYLTVLLHSQDYLAEIHSRGNASIFDPDILVAIRSYNRALTELFTYLKPRNLHNASSFELTAAGGQRISFIMPHYSLPVAKEHIRDFKLCADYRAVNLTHNTRKFGVGAQLICELADNAIPETVFADEQVIPGTLVIRIEEPIPGQDQANRVAQLYYLDSRTIDQVPGKSFNLPLAQDFSIPLAYMVRKPPAVNYLRRAFIVKDDDEGLYHLEPHHDDRIPIVLVHGLMSDIRTWTQMINTLLSDPLLRKHYRFMGFTYSSGNPIFISAMHLRQALQEERDKLVRDNRDLKSFDRMVVIGHSMGGLLTRLLISESSEELMRQRYGEEFSEVLKRQQDETLAQMLIFKPFPSVKRAIFIAVPHRGTTLAGSFLGKYASSFIQLPKSLLDLNVNIITTLTNLGAKHNYTGKDILTGIDNLSADNNALKLMEQMPMAKIPIHSIIGNRNGGDIPGGSDGVVDYLSSHLNEVRSEKVVKSGHSVQQNPLAIQEIRRILREHLKSFPDIEAEFEK